jgi:hypothetical protein
MSKFTSTLTKLAVAAVAVGGFVSTSQASVRLSLTDVGAAVSLTCDTAFAVSAVNCDAASGFSILGAGTGIGFNATIGGFSVFTTTFASNIPGAATGATLDTSTTRVTRNSAGLGDLRIDLAGFNYMLPAGVLKSLHGSASLSSSTGGGAGSLLFTQFMVNALNAFPTAVVDPTLACTISPIGATSANCDAGALQWSDPLEGTFSMRQVAVIRLNQGSTVNTTGTQTVNSVPEPMTLSLVGAALLGVAAAARRRSNKA